MQKKLLVSLAVIATSTIAHAESDSMNSLAYRVKTNEFHYDLGMDFGKTKYNTSERLSSSAASTAVKKSFENSATNWTNDLSYGVNDSFSLSVGVDLALTNTLKQTAQSDAGTVFTSAAVDNNTNYSPLEMKNDGLRDVRVGSSYRYLTGEVKADLLVGVTFSGKGKVGKTNSNNATSTYVASNGDAKLGGSEIQLGTQLSGAMGSFEWSTAAALNYKMKKTFTIVGRDSITGLSALDYDKEIKANMDFALGLDGQYNINSSFAVGASLLVNLAATEEGTASAYAGHTTKTTETSTDKAHTDMTLGLDGKYQVMSNVALGLNYSHLFGADIDGAMIGNALNASATEARTTSITDRKDDRFGFNVAVKF